MRAAADGEHDRRQSQIAGGKAGGHDVAAGRAHHVGLLDGKNAGGIGTGFELGLGAIGAHGLDDEVRAGAAEQSAGIAAAGPQPVVRTIRKLANFLHQLVAFDVGIEHVRRADLQGHVRGGHESGRLR